MTLSLRRRATLAGVLLAAMSLVVGGVVLLTSIDVLAVRRLDSRLAERHLGLVAAFAEVGSDEDALARLMIDPRYARPLSGLYWQVVPESGGVATSRSLVDATLSVPPADGVLRLVDANGPDGRVRLAVQEVSPGNGSSAALIVAESTAERNEERWETARAVASGFAAVGLFGVIFAIMQVSAILRPLSDLQRDIVRRWDQGQRLEPADYPLEVEPLVRDINTLLDRNREVISRSRGQGADLAHALKTPLAILRNALEDSAGEGRHLDEARSALLRVDAAVSRSLARVRSADLSAGLQGQSDLRLSAERVARLFRATETKKAANLVLEVAEGLRVWIDAADLEEILGNLLDNALRHSRDAVRLKATGSATGVEIMIEDDGIGIAEPNRITALRAGGRLDLAPSGTGLGLTIASDIIAAYGGTLELGSSSDLGGLAVRLFIPARHGL